MKNLAHCVLISGLLAGAFGCSNGSAEKVAADARVEAADARVDAADARVDAANARVKAANTPAKAAVKPSRVAIVIPSGTLLKVSLIDGVDSETSSTGDHFLANLEEAIVVDGVTVLEKGTDIRGRVIEAEGSGRVNGRASIRLELTDIVQGEKMTAIDTSAFSAVADATKKRDAGIIAGGAGIGAAIGAIAGGKKGAGIGAIAGGGGGTGAVLATKGKDLHYGPETRLSFTLTKAVEL